MSTSTAAPRIVPVHGAWADGSSWNAVIRPLLAMGLLVLVAPLPLTSLTDAVAALDRTIERTEGPVTLVAHAHAGAVIAGSASERVRSLVFIAALVPDEGGTVADVFCRLPAHPDTAKLAPDANGLTWMDSEDFGKAFAQHATSEQAGILAAVQRPISVACIQQPVLKPGWKTKPSWFLIAEEDRMINPETQRFIAARMNAQISSRRVDHTPLVTSPDQVVEIVGRAVKAPG